MPLTSVVVDSVTALPTNEPDVSSRADVPSAFFDAHTRKFKWPMQPAVEARRLSPSVQAPARKLPLYAVGEINESPAVVAPEPVPAVGRVLADMNDVDAPVAIDAAVAPKNA
jgi:hypothetical protein